MMSVMDHSVNHNNDNTNNNINDGDMRICDSSTDRRRSSVFSAIGDETLPFNLLEDVRLPNNGNGPNDTETERNIDIEIERQIRRKSKNIRELFANILNRNQIQNCSYVGDINTINTINPINTVNSVNSVNGNNMDITTNNGIVVTTNANGMNTDMPMSSSSFDGAVRAVNGDSNTPNNQNDILVVNNYKEYNDDDNDNDNDNNNGNSVRRKSALLLMKEMGRQSDDSVFGAFYPVNLTSGGNSTGENVNGNLNNPIINHQSVASSSPQPLQVGQAPTSASLLPSSVHPNNNEIAITNNDGTTDIIVTEPGPYDIVCGRNNGAFNYVGNRRFRVTIEMNFRRYVNSPTREDKTNVIKSIVTMLRDRVGARFLKKVPPGSQHHQRNGNGGTGGDYSSIDYNKNQYTIMTEKQCREKVGHALRDMVMAARKEYNARTA